MGEVYRALARGPDGVEKHVAIKLVLDSLLRKQELVEMFIEEAKVSFLLTHPNVVQTYELGQVESNHFLVMEYVEGTNLEEVLQFFTERLKQPLPLSFALHIASLVMRGLSYAHNLKDAQGRPLGIVHRDVSPSNVLLSKDGQVKVADFGLAKSALRRLESDSGTIKGKLAYMSPEQVSGEAVDARADIYSVGLMMYEMICGRHPFGDLQELTLLRRMKRPTVAPLAELSPRLDPPVAELVERCMAEEPDKRPSSAMEVGRRIDQYVRDSGLTVADYELAEFIAQARQEAEARPSLPHPFDRALGMELERVAGEGGVSTFIAVPSSEPLPPEGGRHTSPHPEGSRIELSTAMLPAGRHAMGWAVAVGVLLALIAGGVVLLRLHGDPEAGVERAALGPDQGALLPDTAAPAATASQPAEPPREATLRILSEPAGARIVVDGKPRGTSPLTIAGLPAGKRIRVQAEASGRRSYDEHVILEPGAFLFLRPRLERVRRPGTSPRAPKQARARGALSVNTEPWTIVFIDGVRAGHTPLVRHKLDAGEHKVRLVNPGKGIDHAQSVTVTKEKETRLSLEL